MPGLKIIGIVPEIKVVHTTKSWAIASKNAQNPAGRAWAKMGIVKKI